MRIQIDDHRRFPRGGASPLGDRGSTVTYRPSLAIVNSWPDPLIPPERLGPLDVGLIYFRRHLAQHARDWQRLGAAAGALKSRPPRVEEPQQREEVEAP